MGSSVSAVFADLCLESFEQKVIATSSYKPRIWKRVVDDTFTILECRNVDSFLEHLNNQQPSIPLQRGHRERLETRLPF